MIKDQAMAVSERVATWPEDRQQELELALEIEAELAGAGYEATPDELAAIDEGLVGEAATDEEVKAAFAVFPWACGSNIRSGPSPIFDKSPRTTPGPPSGRR